MARTMKITKKCKVCGAVFRPGSSSALYCSEACRKIGTRQARKQWEAKTDYRAKQREYQSRRRQEDAKAKEKKATETEAKREGARRRSQAQARALLEEKAAAGDHFARMLLAKRAGDLLTYWKEFAAYEIEFAENAGYPSKRTVNGISVYLPDFAEQVIREAKERNCLIFRMD